MSCCKSGVAPRWHPISFAVRLEYPLFSVSYTVSCIMLRHSGLTKWEPAYVLNKKPKEEDRVIWRRPIECEQYSWQHFPIPLPSRRGNGNQVFQSLYPEHEHDLFSLFVQPRDRDRQTDRRMHYATGSSVAISRTVYVVHSMQHIFVLNGNSGWQTTEMSKLPGCLIENCDHFNWHVTIMLYCRQMVKHVSIFVYRCRLTMIGA